MEKKIQSGLNMNKELEIKTISPMTWNSFEQLMQTDPQCSDCWCLNHREPAGCPTGTAAKEKMKMLLANSQVMGLLAFVSDECVGWLGIDPMSILDGHDCQKTGKK